MLNKFLGSYSEVELKTAGWVSGVESMEPAVNFRVGSILKLL